MSETDRYLAELAAALRVSGRVRRRFLSECREHLADAAAERGESAAVAGFGPAASIAAEFDREVATRRSVRSTLAAVVGVVATGGSTLALINAASGPATASTPAAIAFFVLAQLAAVAAALASVQALVARREETSATDLVLLARRNACALLATAGTMLAAGAAVPGQGSAVLLLAGPVLLLVGGLAVLRARRLARRLAPSAGRGVRWPLDDLERLVGRPLPALGPGRLLPLTMAVAAACAFLRDRAEHDTAAQALAVAGVEAAAVVGCFVLLGPALGLWRR